VRHTWGEDRVFFFAEDGTQKSLPRAWTDVADVDVFVTLAEGRCPFRIRDLVALAELMSGLMISGGSDTTVNEILP